MIAAVFHAVLILIVFVWAARTGRLDPLLKAFDVVIAPKEKKVEPKTEEPKQDTIKQDELPKLTQAAPVATPPPASAGAPPPSAAPPAAAPPATALPSFDFSDGAKVVESSTNAPVLYYKSQIEFALRSNWKKPVDAGDNALVAEVEVSVDPAGKLTGFDWKKGSGNSQWDDSVRKALAATKSVNRPPPKGFPGKFIVRFDVIEDTEPLVQ